MIQIFCLLKNFVHFKAVVPVLDFEGVFIVGLFTKFINVDKFK